MTPNTLRVIVGIMILMHVILVLCMHLYTCVPVATTLSGFGSLQMEYIMVALG